MSPRERMDIAFIAYNDILQRLGIGATEHSAPFDVVVVRDGETHHIVYDGHAWNNADEWNVFGIMPIHRIDLRSATIENGAGGSREILFTADPAVMGIIAFYEQATISDTTVHIHLDANGTPLTLVAETEIAAFDEHYTRRVELVFNAFGDNVGIGN